MCTARPTRPASRSTAPSSLDRGGHALQGAATTGQSVYEKPSATPGDAAKTSRRSGDPALQTGRKGPLPTQRIMGAPAHLRA